MGLTGLTPETYGTAVGDTCFYCGRLTRDPAVLWLGHTGRMVLHPPCVVELTIRLMRDLHEWECARGESFSRFFTAGELDHERRRG